jgi:phage tail P2-like protein
MSTQSLLPDNRTLLETALEQTIKAHLQEIDSVYPSLWDPATVPVHLLPYLAQAKGVPDWGNDTELSKRNTVANIWPVQRQAGTRKAVKDAVDTLGFDADVTRSSTPYHLKVDLWREDLETIEADVLARAKRRIGYVKSERDVIKLTLNASSSCHLNTAIASTATLVATSLADIEDQTNLAMRFALAANHKTIQTVTECY